MWSFSNSLGVQNNSFERNSVYLIKDYPEFQISVLKMCKKTYKNFLLKYPQIEAFNPNMGEYRTKGSESKTIV